MATLDEMETRAQRHLDGMTVNRDAIAQDVLTLCSLVRILRDRQQTSCKPHDYHTQPDYDAIFGDLFGLKK